MSGELLVVNSSIERNRKMPRDVGIRQEAARTDLKIREICLEEIVQGKETLIDPCIVFCTHRDTHLTLERMFPNVRKITFTETDEEFLALTPHENEELKTFVIANNEYCAHCGLWYTTGETAYVEPVVTAPEHRKQGLAKAAIYEACTRAKVLGAKRAVVLSAQEFYYRIGFTLTSEVYCWESKI